ncbi:MAG: hypothetical protein Q9202_000810 [Teloschistes flavicans]
MPAVPDPQMASSERTPDNGAPISTVPAGAYDPDYPNPQPFQPPIPATGGSPPSTGPPPAYDPSSGGNVAGAGIWTTPGTTTTTVYEQKFPFANPNPTHGLSSDDDDSHTNGGAIAGGVIGAVAALVLAYLLYRYIKTRRTGSGGGSAGAMPPAASFMSGFRERLAKRRGEGGVDAEKRAVASGAGGGAGGAGGRDDYVSHHTEE